MKKINCNEFKIVLVGDVNVGKTRLICARAYRKPTPIEQFPKVAHNSSVWAIDQYRLDSSVLFNSYVNVDNVLVSHRLWDTFGAHDRDRRFAFGHADVVLLCFSICSAQSLRSVKRFWYEEARRHRKNIPYFIVGCKADLRHCDLDKFNAHRGQLAPKVKKSDILFPWEGREVANEMKLPYYETSCVTGDGVDDLFTNALRAALLTRRRFWRSHLKGVQRPLPQAPLLPPMPPEETIQIQLNQCSKSEDNKENVKNQHCLPLFAPFFRCQTNSDLNLQIGKTTFHAHRCIIHSKTDRFDFKGESALSLEAIEYIYDVGGLGEKITQSPIRFLSEYESKAARLSLLQNGKYSDVTLVLEDGKIEAHRILLASGSELMRAMLIGSWREAESKEIKLTDIYYDQMVECCRWIYARVLPDWSCPTKKLIEMIPIVSRLCLTVYFHKLENVIIDRLKNSTLHIGLRFGIQALEICEQHNAKRLTGWIMRHLSVNFNEINSVHRIYYLKLTEDKREIIENNQWPPEYYVKERALYEKTLKQIEKSKNRI